LYGQWAALTSCTSVLFSAYFILSIWSIIPTAEEKAERAAEQESDIEMRKYTVDYKTAYESPDSEMSKEEKWERNRQIFLNLPKTPNTPGFATKNPMTPRTVAFTALNGGEGPSRLTRPTGALPFRQQFGDQQAKVPDAR